jgi:ketosteroid isomerase-like protein
MGSTVAPSPDTNDRAAQLRRNLLGESLHRDGVVAHRDEGGDIVLERHQHGKDEQAVSEPGHARRSRRICASRTTAAAKMRATVSAAAGNQDELVPYASGMTESNGNTSTVDVFSALIADWNQAVVANDPDAIAAFAEPDWVFVGENGIFPGEQFLEAVATGQVSHDFMTSEVHDVRVYGDVAIVIARVRNRGEFGGDPFTLDEWSTDVFVRRGDRWRCSVTHLTSVAATTPAT